MPISLALVTLWVGLLLIQRQTQQTTSSLDQTAVPWTYPRKMKVVILRYFHPNSEYKDPALAKLITDTIQGQIRVSSQFHGSINPTVMPAVEIEVVGTQDFTTGRPDPIPGNWEASYNAMLEPLCEQIFS